jgi:hypothetical protein
MSKHQNKRNLELIKKKNAKGVPIFFLSVMFYGIGFLSVHIFYCMQLSHPINLNIFSTLLIILLGLAVTLINYVILTFY